MEAQLSLKAAARSRLFPFLFGGAFIEAGYLPTRQEGLEQDFPSSWEGLSLRRTTTASPAQNGIISLPFGKGIH